MKVVFTSIKSVQSGIMTAKKQDYASTTWLPVKATYSDNVLKQNCL